MTHSKNNEEVAFLLFIDVAGHNMAMTTDKGTLFIVDANTQQKTYTQKAHKLEAWTVANKPLNSHILYTGGDDALVKGWDTRVARDHVFASRR
jgi:WD40 repeat protein